VEQVRVFIADADRDERDDLARAVEQVGAIVAGSGATDEQVLARIVATDPEVVIVHIETAEQAIDLCRRMLDARPRIRCLILATATDEEAFLQAVLVGAAGFVRREQLAAAMSGASPRLREVADELLERHGVRETERLLAELTPLQREVALLVVSGATNREIGEALHLSPHTVRNYLSRIMTQFRARNRTELAVELASVLLRTTGRPDGTAAAQSAPGSSGEGSDERPSGRRR
jgi:two-component system response regulator DevR